MDTASPTANANHTSSETADERNECPSAQAARSTPPSHDAQKLLLRALEFEREVFSVPLADIADPCARLELLHKAYAELLFSPQELCTQLAADDTLLVRHVLQLIRETILNPSADLLQCCSADVLGRAAAALPEISTVAAIKSQCTALRLTAIAALEDLPPEAREIFFLSRIPYDKQESTCKQLHWTEKQIQTRLQRARRFATLLHLNFSEASSSAVL